MIQGRGSNAFVPFLYFWGLVLTSAIVGVGLCACPNGGNHRWIAPTEGGRSYDQALLGAIALLLEKSQVSVYH
jgi:hypothetical protein